MPSRKRNLSPDSNAHISTNLGSRQVPAKRIKLTSHTSSNRTGAGFQKQENSRVICEPAYYSIKSILKEKRGRYLIDWEDDPVTGEQFKPTWEPKGHANAEAVADFQRKRITGRGSNKRRTANTNVSSTPAASKSSIPVTRRCKSRKVVITPPTQFTAPPQNSSPRLEVLEIKDSQVAERPVPPSEYLAVQVSQHSSFDPDQYVQFLASSSNQDLSSSQQKQHPDSGVGSTSPPEDLLTQRVIDYEERVVPDSQSLAGPLKYTSIDSPIAKEAEPQAADLVTGSPGVRHHQTSPFYSPCPDQLLDISRGKERNNTGTLEEQEDHQTSPFFSPCPERLLDIPRVKERDNTGSPELQEDHQASPFFSPCPEQLLDISRVKKEDNQVGYPFTGSLEVPNPQTICENHRESPFFSPRLEGPSYTSGAKERDNQVVGGLQILQGSPAIRSPFDAQKDIPLPTIELDNHEVLSSQIPPAQSQLLESFTSPSYGPPSSLSADNDTMAERPQPITNEHTVPSPAATPSTVAHIPLRERLKELRARSAAKVKAEREARYATYNPRVIALLNEQASHVQSLLNQAPQEKGNSMPVGLLSTSLVVDDDAELCSQQSNADLQNGISQQSSSSSSFGDPLLGKMEYAIPLSLNSNIVEQYKQTLYNSRHDIKRFLQHEVAEEPHLISNMRAMIVQLIKLTIHGDLDDSMVMTQEQISGTDEAQWAKTCSGKFEFLGGFITAARTADMHVVIIVSEGKLLDYLETFLKAYHAVYVRPDVMRRSDSAAQGPLRFTLLATTDMSSIVSTAALVIAFDELVNTQEPRVTALRAHMFEVGKLSPLIHLLVVNSAEHVEKCLPSSLTGVQRLQALVSCVAQTRHKVGQLPEGTLGPREAAVEMAAFLSLGGRDDQSKLPGMPRLVDVELFESSTQTGSSRPSATPQSPGPEIAAPLNRKRSMVDDDHNTSVAKRSRLTPVADISHISDSITQPSQMGPGKVDELQRALDKAEERLESFKATHSAREFELQNTIANAQQRLEKAEEQVESLKATHSAREIDLQTTIRNVQQRLEKAEEQVQSLQATHSGREVDFHTTVANFQQRLQLQCDTLSELQYRYEARSADLHTLRSERDAAVAASALAHHRSEIQRVEIARLKEHQRALETDLKDIRTMLVSSAVPEVATLESAKAEVVQLATDKAQLEKRLASLTKDFEFTRQQYQLASTAAAENASALSDLQTEVSALRVQASGEAARLRQLSMSTENQVHLERAKQLEATLKERDDVLHKREEELRDIKRGRGLATRASSAPRSPRLGSRASSPMSGFLAGSAGRGGSALRFGG